MKIAIDFDDTITEKSPFPICGEIRKECIPVINQLYDMNHMIVIWTARSGKYIKEMKKKLKSAGIKYDFINYIPDSKSKKINADIFIDDKNIFCNEIDWNQIKKYFEQFGKEKPWREDYM